MATVYVIWGRSERKVVPSDDSTYATSQQATDAARRMTSHAGNHKDVQNRVYDILGPLTIT